MACGGIKWLIQNADNKVFNVLSDNVLSKISRKHASHIILTVIISRNHTEILTNFSSYGSPFILDDASTYIYHLITFIKTLSITRGKPIYPVSLEWYFFNRYLMKRSDGFRCLYFL